MQSSALIIASERNAPNVRAMMVRGFVLALAAMMIPVAGSVRAEGEGKGPPPRPDDRGKGPRNGMFGRPPGGMDQSGWDQLSEEEKKTLRTAIEKVWETPDVSAAREKIMKAMGEMRTTLRTALEKTDPAAARVLEKVKTPFPWPTHRGAPPMPRPEDPNFARQATMRLGFEMMSIGKPEQREALRHLHERLMQLPAVKEAVAKLEAAPAGERIEAFKALREVYQKEREREITEFRSRHRDEQTPEEKK